MRTDKFIDDLKQALIPVAIDCVQRLVETTKGGHIYSFCIYCASGCTSVGIAAQTLEALDLVNKVAGGDKYKEFVNLVSATEWSIVYADPMLFENSNRLISEFYEVLFDGEFEDVDFEETTSTRDLQRFADDLFCRAFVQTFMSLKEAGVFGAQPFTEDVFLGLQFGDATNDDAYLVETVSAQVNSVAWHDIVKQYCALLKSRSAHTKQ